ncbi:MAG TPA: ATP-binding cassette domain-containing protein [Bacilli bacterium]|nr:ATP-binding cassette domain-containing protein [Bacilli bacterium]
MAHAHDNLCLQLQEVKLRDKSKVLYENLTFTLRPGEIGAVYGPSRSGKSSLLLLASGQLRPDAGRVTVGGGRPDLHKAGLGPIHDLNPLFDTLTLEEHLLFQGRLHGVRHVKQRVAELLDHYELASVKKRRVKDVGHLEQFRIGLTTALIHRPDLILIDEPERGLTNEEWELAARDLQELAREGHTVLLTTVLAQVADGCQAVLELPSGEVTVR